MQPGLQGDLRGGDASAENDNYLKRVDMIPVRGELNTVAVIRRKGAPGK